LACVSAAARPGGTGEFLTVLAGLLLVAGIAVATGVGILVLLYRSELILPGVVVLGVEVGGQFVPDAADALQRVQSDRPIVLDGGDCSWSMPANELGIHLDTQRTARQAHQQSRAPERIRSLREGNWVVEVAPLWAVDTGQATGRLEMLAAEYRVPPVNARIVLVDGQVEAIPSADGRSLDIQVTLENLVGQPESVLETGRLELASQPVPPLVIDVSEARTHAEALLSNPPVIGVYDPVTDEQIEWPVLRQEWSQWLVPSVDPTDISRLIWQLDTGRARTFITNQAGSLAPERYLDLDAVDAMVTSQTWADHLRVFHHPIQHVAQPGDTLASIGRAYGIPYPCIQEANPGLEDTLRTGQTLIVPSPDEMLPLPIVAGKRIVVHIGGQRAEIYEDGTLKWEWPVSTGIASSPTWPGVFQVQSHELNAYAASWDLWMPFFLGIYRPVPTATFMNGFHGFPTRGGTQLLWTNSLGRPVTYGCILLEQTNAQVLFEWAEEGTVVEIRP
jgi:lipoprotein-anchoring transpeptidase ErfK/SrfK